MDSENLAIEFDPLPPNVIQDAARWDFMMTVADDPEGLEAKALEAAHEELLDSTRSASEQLCEIVDEAMKRLDSLSKPAPAPKIVRDQGLRLSKQERQGFNDWRSP